MRIEFRGSVQSSNGTNSAVARISAGCDGNRGGMAGKHRARAKIGRRTSTAEHPSAKRNLFAAGAFCFGAAQTAPGEKNFARPRHKFPCARVCAHVKKTPQCYAERHYCAAARITPKLDPRRVGRVCGGSF